MCGSATAPGDLDGAHVEYASGIANAIGLQSAGRDGLGQLCCG
jgi:3-deoxy-D-arabino-heptulosonate 7-phosphate (DAHP) synthase class II